MCLLPPELPFRLPPNPTLPGCESPGWVPWIIPHIHTGYLCCTVVHMFPRYCLHWSHTVLPPCTLPRVRKSVFYVYIPLKWSEVAQLCPTFCDPMDYSLPCQAPPSMGFSRQEYWSGLPCPSPGDLPNPGIKPGSPALQADSLPSELPGKPLIAALHIGSSVGLSRFHIYVLRWWLQPWN